MGREIVQTLKFTVGAACAGILLLASSTAVAAGDAERGKAKSVTCQACHGPDGNSPDPQFPKLAGQHADYLAKALEDYKSGARNNAIMAGFAATLSEQDREDLAAFYASQSGTLSSLER
jgi:cytochrome c553